MKDSTKRIRDAIVVVLRQSFPLPMSTRAITLEMPWHTGQQTRSSTYKDWHWWEGRDDMELVALLDDLVVYRRRPWSSEVYNSLRALERKGVISRLPRDPGLRDRYWTYLPDPKVDNEIHDLDKLLEMS